MDYIILVPLETEEDIKLVLLSHIECQSYDENCIVNALNKKLKTSLYHSSGSPSHFNLNNNKGFIILKNYKAKNIYLKPHDVEFKFNVYLANKTLTSYIKENRVFIFWYRMDICHDKNIIYKTTNSFLGELFKPHEFPRDYVRFVMRIMKLMQKYEYIDTMQIKFRTSPDAIPRSNIVQHTQMPLTSLTLPINDNNDLAQHVDEEDLIKFHVLQIIESIYPSSISLSTLSEHVKEILSTLIIVNSNKAKDLSSHNHNNSPLPHNNNHSTVNSVCNLKSHIEPKELERALHFIPTVLKSLIDAGKVKQFPDGTYLRVNQFIRIKSISSDEASLAGTASSKINRFSVGDDATETRWKAIGFGHEPVVAIITSLFCEKLAVDSMLDNAYTFVKYKSQGSHHLYTIGNIGNHKIVSIKLSMLGKTRHSMISASNAVTRLLGTFPSIKYVFIVGTGSAINRFTDYRKKFKFGDIVVSTMNPGCDYIYARFVPNPDINTIKSYLNVTRVPSEIGHHPDQLVNQRYWKPKSPNLGNLVHDMVSENIKNSEYHPWNEFAHKARLKLNGEQNDFTYEPPLDANFQIPISIGGDDYLFLDESFEEKIKSNHNYDSDNSTTANNNSPGHHKPSIHLGAIGSYRIDVKSSQGTNNTTIDSTESKSIKAAKSYLQEFVFNVITPQYGILAYDKDFDLVLDAVQGNCIENFILIRGISDFCKYITYGQEEFRDESLGQFHYSSLSNPNQASSWASYASLNAAAFAKAMIIELDL